MNENLLKAILSMDAYNRGYDAGIDESEFSSTTHIGNASIIQQSNVTLGSDERNASFYAIAYDLDGQKIISYRGTDDSADVSNGWLLGGGNINVPQAEMALQFYQSIAGSGNWHSADIELTGHSMGGGLAGYIAALYGKDAKVFDSMNFSSAANSAYFYASISPSDPQYTTLAVPVINSVYAGGAPWAVDESDVSGYAIDGEALSDPLLGVMIGYSGDVVLSLEYDNDLDDEDLHSISALIIRMFANYGGIGDTALATDWHNAASYFWPVLYDDDFAETIGMDSIDGAMKDRGEYSNILRTIISYSAIDDGTFVYGNTAIRSLYDDANDLGKALDHEVSGFISTMAPHISQALIQYAGHLALNKTLASSANGILTHSGTETNETLTIDFSDAKWDVGTVDLTEIISRNTMLNSLLAASIDPDTLLSYIDSEWNIDYDDIDRIIYAVHSYDIIQISEAPSFDDEATLYIGTGDNDDVTGSSGRDLIVTGEGDDWIHVTAGSDADIIEGGDGMDVLHYYNAQDAAVTINLADDIDHLGNVRIGIEGAAGTKYNDTFIDVNGVRNAYLGREGIDTVDFSGALAGLTIDLRGDEGVGDDILIQVEKIIGSDFNDVIHSNADVYVHQLGNLHQYDGGSGTDTLYSHGFLYGMRGVGIQVGGTFNPANEHHYAQNIENFVVAEGQHGHFIIKEMGHNYTSGSSSRYHYTTLDYSGYSSQLTFNIAGGTISSSSQTDNISSVVTSIIANNENNNWYLKPNVVNDYYGYIFSGTGNDSFFGDSTAPLHVFYGGGNDVAEDNIVFFMPMGVEAEDLTVAMSNIYLDYTDGDLFYYKGDITLTVDGYGQISYPDRFEYVYNSDNDTYTILQKYPAVFIQNPAGVQGFITDIQTTYHGSLPSLSFGVVRNLLSYGDTYFGTLGNDNFNFNQYNGESIYDGLAGDDTIVMSSSRGAFVGAGSGIDTVKFSGSFTSYTFNQDNHISLSKSGRSYDIWDAEWIVFGGTTFSANQIMNQQKGTSGDDAQDGTSQDDFISGYEGNDEIDGGDGNDIIDGGSSSDIIYGGNGNDSIYGGYGEDVLTGDDGADKFVFEYFDGSFDIISDFNYLEGDKLDLSVEALFDASLGNIGNFMATSVSGGDTYLYVDADGTGTDYTWETVAILADLEAYASPIYLINAGIILVANSYFGTESANASLNGDITNDIIFGRGGADVISGLEGNDAIYGGTGADTIYGGDGVDLLYGEEDNDTISGGDGDDTINGFTGNDTMDGGNGNDTLSYVDAGSGVTISLASGSAQSTSGSGTDTISNFENLFGSAHNDTLTGDGNSNTIEGGAGNDALNGGLGTDTLSYRYASAGVTVNLSTATAQNTVGAGTDTLTSFENIVGSAYNDTLTGTTAGNVMEGGLGNDSIDGNSGGDTARYASETSGVNVNLSVTTDQNTGGAGTDTLTSIENLIGSAYSDTLTGGSGTNTLDGGDGDDTIQGGAGADTMIGGNGADTVSYSSATSTVTVSLALTTAQSTGSTGTDTISGFENLTGSAYNDTLSGDAGDNVINGLDGDDTFNADAGNDTINGGNGSDTLNFAAIVSGITLNLSLTSAQDTGGAGIDTVTGIENITGTAAVDILTGNSANNNIHGGNGYDTIEGGDGDDTLTGGGGNDKLLYSSASAGVIVNLSLTTAQNTIGAGIDTLSTFENLVGSAFNDDLTGSSAINIIEGGDGDDVIEGGDGNDNLKGDSGYDTVRYSSATAGVTVNLATTTAQNTVGAGYDTLSSFSAIIGSAYNDTLTGDSFSNTIEGGDGDDTLDGVSGTDTVSYRGATAGVTVNLATATAQSTIGAGTDTITNFDNIKGSSHNDTLTGDGNTNVIEGGAGDDTLDGAGGTDTISYESATAGIAISLAVATAQNTGGAGTDTISNFERIVGSAYNDTLTGSSTTNMIEGGAGNDTMDGGGGTDTLTYANASAGVIVSLALTTAQNTGGAGTDTISNFEYLTGSAFADTLSGSSLANTIRGGAGNDLVYGGLGADTLYGEANADTFVFKTEALGTSDTIADFSLAQEDALDISDLLVGYNPLTSAIEDFLIFTTAGANTTIAVDRDGIAGTYSAQTIASITGVTGLDASDMLVSGNIIA